MIIEGVKHAGIVSTLSDTKETIEGISRFIDTASGIINIVISIIGILGFKALILFFTVLFLSTGFSYIGIPKGKASFFSSLTLANLIWFAWERSFNPDSYSFLISMLQTNLILLIPFISILLLKRVLPFVFRKIFSRIILFFKIPFISKRVIDNNKIINLSEKYQQVSSHFQLSLLRDILHNRDDKIILSITTHKSIKDLEEIIKGFHKLSN